MGQSEYELALLSRGRRDALVGGGQPSGSPTRGAGLGSLSASFWEIAVEVFINNVQLILVYFAVYADLVAAVLDGLLMMEARPNP